MFERSGVTEAELTRLGRKVVRKGGKQVLLIASGGRLFAVANRCPHEGYPLSEGTLGPPCVLTCDWHNWKFDLASGETLVGRDPVRAYPVRVEDGEIAIDLADPPADLQRERALRGLAAAMADNDRTRMAREVARLERAGFDARVALVHAIESVSGRLEGGMTHAHAAAADWLGLSERAPTADLRLTALLEPIGHLAEDTLGAGRFPYAEGLLAWDAEAFLAAMEAEDEFAGQARVARRARGRHDLRRAAAGARRGGARPLRRLRPQRDLRAEGRPADRAAGRCGAPGAVLQALIRQLIYARREDRLPEFRGYAGALAAWSARRVQPAARRGLHRAFHRGGPEAPCRFGRPSASGAVRRAAGRRGLEHAALRRRARPGGRPGDRRQRSSWLDFTHALTFANAARHLCTDEPALWPAALLQLALFVGRNKPFVKAQQDVSAWSVRRPAGVHGARDDGALRPRHPRADHRLPSR